VKPSLAKSCRFHPSDDSQSSDGQHSASRRSEKKLSGFVPTAIGVKKTARFDCGHHWSEKKLPGLITATIGMKKDFQVSFRQPSE
jgi:hypothetical protein